MKHPRPPTLTYRTRSRVDGEWVESSALMGQGCHGYTSCIQRIMVPTHQHDRAKAVAHRVLLTTRGLRAVLGPDVGGHAWQVRHVINYLSNSLLMQSPETLATRLLVSVLTFPGASIVRHNLSHALTHTT